MDAIINHLRSDESVEVPMLGKAFDVRKYLEGSAENMPGEPLKNLQGYNPSVRELIALKHIYEKGSLTTAEIKEILNLSQSTVNTVLNSLSSLNLLKRVRDSRENRYTVANPEAVKLLLERYGDLAGSR